MQNVENETEWGVEMGIAEIVVFLLHPVHWSSVEVHYARSVSASEAPFHKTCTNTDNSRVFLLPSWFCVFSWVNLDNCTIETEH